jgi:hypothetical protein
MSRPAPRRHRAARPLALASGPVPAVEGPVDVRPKPERFCYLRSERKRRGAVIRTCMVPGLYEPGARLAIPRSTTPSKPYAPSALGTAGREAELRSPS